MFARRHTVRARGRHTARSGAGAPPAFPVATAALSAAAVAAVILGPTPSRAQPAGTVAGDGADDAKATAIAEAEALHAEIRRLALTLWDFAEVGLKEDRSAATLERALEAAGFTVEKGVAGMPTAFVARFTRGQGGPTLGVLAEYDALPGVGNETVPRRARRDDGVASGHGCGHNLFGAGSVAGAIALKRTMESEGLPGTIVVYGTPAEETLVGKVYMAREGVFDELDAALVWHPGQETQVDNSSSLAMNNFTVEFRGQAAHGAADPWNGRSALDAVELMDHGVNAMREHVRPTARIHYVIPDGGEAPNVVPEYARAWYYVRDTARSTVEGYYAWIKEIARGAALMTRTEHEVKLVTGVHATLLNRPLQEAAQANLERVGAPEFPEEFREFGRELQRSLDLEPTGLDTEVRPLADESRPAGGGSTDVAEVSRITPTVSFNVTTAPASIPWHSWATTASHGREGSTLAATVAAKVIAATGVDLLTRPELLEAARTDFDERMAGRAYESPLPPDQPPPLPETVEETPGGG